MYSKVLFIFFMFSVLVSEAEREFYVEWKGPSALTSSDFRMKVGDDDFPDKRKGKKVVRKEGYILTGIHYSFLYDGTKVEYEVVAHMNPEESWLRDTSDLAVLRHEQGHFNITEIYARKIRKALSSTRNPDQAGKVYNRYIEAMKEEQQRFDSENSNEKGISEKWEHKIKKELEELSAWSSVRVTPG